MPLGVKSSPSGHQTAQTPDVVPQLPGSVGILKEVRRLEELIGEFNAAGEKPRPLGNLCSFVRIPVREPRMCAVSAPDPNGWFRARVVVASPRVSVFVGDAKEPCLVVDQLSTRGKGLVGLWVGNTSGGDFANLKIVPA
jgi:hypothetical protein